MKSGVKVAALAIAGACLSVIGYILGLDDGVKQSEPMESVSEKPTEDEDLGADTQ